MHVLREHFWYACAESALQRACGAPPGEFCRQGCSRPREPIQEVAFLADLMAYDATLKVAATVRCHQDSNKQVVETRPL